MCKDYEEASATYAAGARLGAPPWMAAMAARMRADGGSRVAAGQMYQHLYDSTGDEAVKQMIDKQLMRLDSLDERDLIRGVLQEFKARNGRCANSWREVQRELGAASIEITRLNDPSDASSVKSYHTFKFDKTGAPLDPSSTPYELIKGGCDVDLDINTEVPFK